MFLAFLTLIFQACDPVPPPCENLSEWSDWEKCSVSACGEKGRRVRKRVCLSGEGTCTKALEQEEACTGKVGCEKVGTRTHTKRFCTSKFIA